MTIDTFFPHEILQEHPSQCRECGASVRMILVGKTAAERKWITVGPKLVKLIISHVFKRHVCPDKNAPKIQDEPSTPPPAPEAA